MRVGIVARKGNPRARSLAVELARTLRETVDVRLDEITAADTDAGIESVEIAEMAGAALVVSVGGDGTFLHVARQVGSTPILGVNLGEVGFLNAVDPENAIDRVREEIEHVRDSGTPRYREVPRIEASAEGLSLPSGLNEIVVQGRGRGHGQGVEVEVRIDGSTYLDDHADGVVVATGTGSTAYNLSEGGPIVHPSASGLLVTPMCPDTLRPPLVVGTDRVVGVRVSGVDEAVVASDGSEREWIDAPAEIEICLAEAPARIAGPRSDFFQALRKID